MDVTYWQQRCEAAEKALQRARRALVMHQVRREVIAALGELTPGQTLTTQALASRLRWTSHRVIYVLGGMARVGLVDRTPEGRCGGRGNQVRWKLGHMVQVEVTE